MFASLGILQLFDLVVITGLVFYYRQLQQDFLKFGAIALAINVVCSLAHLIGLPTAGGLVPAGFEVLAALFFGFCALDIAGRSGLGRRLAVAAVVLYLTALIVSLANIVPEALEPMLLGAPTALLFLFCIVTTLTAANRTMGVLWFAGLSAFAGAAELAVPWLTPSQGLLLPLFHLLIGVALIMIASEQVIRDLGTKDRRIERYVEDRKRLELQFSQAQKLESLGMLAGGIAHDFNNMLTSILGYASLAMKKLPPDSDVRKDLYMVMSGARQAVDLTSQMLTYAGKGALEFESTDISRVVEGLSSLVHSIVPRNVQLVQRLSRDLPSMRGDRVQLGQATMNLIANAVEALEDNPGTIEVATGLTDVDIATLRDGFFAEALEPGAYLYLRVRDTGIGMTPDQVERMFDPFYSDKTSSKGLGLSSLSGIVRQHKGFIRVSSNPGEGTDFVVYFPVLSVSDADHTARAEPVSTRRGGGRVLLADDDGRIRSLIASILESDRYSVISADDGKEALAAWREHRGDFDLLVLDCSMPKLEGPELYRQIRGEHRTVPIALVSGYHQDQVARHIENDPNACFVKKPFNVDDFLERIESLVKRGAGSKTRY